QGIITSSVCFLLMERDMWVNLPPGRLQVITHPKLRIRRGILMACHMLGLTRCSRYNGFVAIKNMCAVNTAHIALAQLQLLQAGFENFAALRALCRQFHVG